MKKILLKSKKVVTTFVLVFVAVCMIAPVALASNNITKYGSRLYNSSGYRSHTKVIAYDNNGVGLYTVTYAQIGVQENYGYGYGTSNTTTQYEGKINAWHAYGIGGFDLNDYYETLWMKN